MGTGVWSALARKAVVATKHATVRTAAASRGNFPGLAGPETPPQQAALAAHETKGSRQAGDARHHTTPPSSGRCHTRVHAIELAQAGRFGQLAEAASKRLHSLHRHSLRRLDQTRARGLTRSWLKLTQGPCFCNDFRLSSSRSVVSCGVSHLFQTMRRRHTMSTDWCKASQPLVQLVPIRHRPRIGPEKVRARGIGARTAARARHGLHGAPLVGDPAEHSLMAPLLPARL